MDGGEVGNFFQVELEGVYSTMELPPCSEIQTFFEASSTIPMGELSDTLGLNSLNEWVSMLNVAILLAYVSVIHNVVEFCSKAISAGPEFAVGGLYSLIT